LALNDLDKNLLKTRGDGRFSETFTASASMRIRMFRNWSFPTADPNGSAPGDAKSFGQD